MSATEQQSLQTKALHFARELLMGGASGVIAKTACAPLERVKILLQVQSASAHLPGFVPYKGIGDCFFRVVREQGALALWRGNFANCIRYFPAQGMNFAFKDYYQRLFIKPREEVGFARYFAGYLLSGACAGATSLSISYPLEFSYTRLAADTGASGKREFTGIIDCIRKTVAKDGVTGIYRGFAPSVAGIIVYRAGYFGLFDLSTDYVLPRLGVSKEQQHTAKMVAAKFLIALSVDIFASLCAYPLDTIRRSLMMQSGKPLSERLYHNTFQCGTTIFKSQGIRGLYKGAYTNSIRAFGSALVLVVFSEIKYLVTGK